MHLRISGLVASFCGDTYAYGNFTEKLSICLKTNPQSDPFPSPFSLFPGPGGGTYAYVVTSVFRVASCKCFIWVSHVFHTHMLQSACSKCFISFYTYVTFKYFFHVASVLRCSVRGELGASKRGCWGLTDGVLRV
jgi:hypothetical protein